MRKLNIKKLAAVAAGTVLVGAALATAAFTDLTKSDVVSAMGQPQLSVVVGSGAAVSDVVWAGNIAAKIAQLATKPMSVTQGTGGTGGTASNVSVDLTVGGTVTYSGGVRELNTNSLNSASSQTEYYDSIGNAYFHNFTNQTLNVTRDNNTSSTSVLETIGIKADGKFDFSTPATKDLIAVVNPNDMNYTVTFTPGFAYPFTDTGTDDYIPINFLGKRYVIDSINSTATNVVLLADGTFTVYNVADTFTALGADGNTTYTIRFDGGATVSGATVAAISLLDSSGTVLQSDQFNSGTDITFRQSSGGAVIVRGGRLQAIGTTTTNNTTVYTFKVVAGGGRVELQSGREVPLDPNSSGANIPWAVSFTTGSGTQLTGITLKNQNYYFQTNSPLYAMQSFAVTGGNTTVPTGFEFFKGTNLDKVGTFSFEGYYTSGVQKTLVEFLPGANAAVGSNATTYGAIHYFDSGGAEHYIPMAIFLSGTSSLVAGSTFTFDTLTHSYATDGVTNHTRFSVKQLSSDTTFASAPDFNQIWDINSDTNWAASGVVQLQGKNSKRYQYLVRRNNGNNGVWLALVGQIGGPANQGSIISNTANLTSPNSAHNGYIDTTQYNAADIFLLGTSTNDANVSTNVTDYNITPQNSGGALDWNSTQRPYYYPDIFDYNGNNGGSSTGIYRTAVFRLNEAQGSSNTVDKNNGVSASTNLFIDTESGNAGTVDTGNNNKTNYAGKTTAVEFYETDQNLTTLSEYLGNPGESSSNYKKAFTNNGTQIALASRKIQFWFPNQAMKAYFTVKAKDITTSTSGGESNTTPLKKDDTFTTTGGTKITIKNITGTCSGGSGTCTPASYEAVVPVGQLVYTDQSPPAGKYVIVGGYLANTLAKNIAVDGTNTLEDKLQTSGQMVAQKLANGNIVVAGYTATDTVNAAKELITALTGLLG